MNPNAPANTGFELPGPPSENSGAAPERGSIPEIAPAPGQPQALAAASAPPVPQAAPLQQQQDTGSAPQAAIPHPAIADDHDLIEKEWVEKAKQIVATTKNDPSIQTRELNKFKASYIQKRYNKTIKFDEA